MRNKTSFLTSVIILLTVVFYYTLEAQQKNVTHRTKFSGVWKTKEPISIGGNIFCSYVTLSLRNSFHRVTGHSRRLLMRCGSDVSTQ